MARVSGYLYISMVGSNCSTTFSNKRACNGIIIDFQSGYLRDRVDAAPFLSSPFHVHLPDSRHFSMTIEHQSRQSHTRPYITKAPKI